MRANKDNLIGKTVMSKEGLIIGKIKEIDKNEKIKEIKNTFITPSKEINLHTFNLSKKGDIILPFKSLTKVKNIYVFEDIDQIVNKTKTIF